MDSDKKGDVYIASLQFLQTLSHCCEVGIDLRFNRAADKTELDMIHMKCVHLIMKLGLHWYGLFLEADRTLSGTPSTGVPSSGSPADSSGTIPPERCSICTRLLPAGVYQETHSLCEGCRSELEKLQRG